MQGRIQKKKHQGEGAGVPDSFFCHQRIFCYNVGSTFYLRQNKWDWPGNATITDHRQTLVHRGRVVRTQANIDAYMQARPSKITSYPFLREMITTQNRTRNIGIEHKMQSLTSCCQDKLAINTNENTDIIYNRPEHDFFCACHICANAYNKCPC